MRLTMISQLSRVSCTSKCTRRPVNNVLHSMALFTLPRSRLCSVNIRARLSSLCRSTSLHFFYGFSKRRDARVRLHLGSGSKGCMPLSRSHFTLSSKRGVFSLPIGGPLG